MFYYFLIYYSVLYHFLILLVKILVYSNPYLKLNTKTLNLQRIETFPYTIKTSVTRVHILQFVSWMEYPNNVSNLFNYIHFTDFITDFVSVEVIYSKITMWLNCTSIPLNSLLWDTLSFKTFCRSFRIDYLSCFILFNCLWYIQDLRLESDVHKIK